jgi:hypothetical protein
MNRPCTYRLGVLMVSELGDRNSSITRVRPVFGHLLSLDPTGHEWLPRLWTLAANKRPQSKVVHPPAIIGSLIADEVTRMRPFTDQNLTMRGYPRFDLPAALERSLPPPHAFLQWLLEHPAALVEPPHAGDLSAQAVAMRRLLMHGDPAESAEAMAFGLGQLKRLAPAKWRTLWWAFEGFSVIDCCLVTPSVVLFIEGKRTEPVSGATAWYPTRHQLWRNVEVAAELAHGRQFGVVLAVEDEVHGHRELAGALNALAASYPHLADERRAELCRHLLGFVTWDELQAAFDIPAACLPNEVSDLYPPITPG